MTAEILIDHPVFTGIDRATLRRTLSWIPVREHRFEHQQVVMMKGDPCDRLNILDRGTLRATIQSPGGKSLLVETLGPPEILAPAVIFAPEPLLPVTLIASSVGRIISMSQESFVEVAGRFPSAYRELMHSAGAKFNFITTKMRLLHFATLRQKVAGYLLERARIAKAHEITLPFGRDRLAELFGVARPSLSRVFGDLANEGFLAVDGRSVSILDADALQQIARGTA